MRKKKVTPANIVPVDSGLLLIIDPCYITENSYKELQDFLENISKKFKKGKVFENPIKYGVVAPTYIGDGDFQVNIWREVNKEELNYKITINQILDF